MYHMDHFRPGRQTMQNIKPGMYVPYENTGFQSFEDLARENIATADIQPETAVYSLSSAA